MEKHIPAHLDSDSTLNRECVVGQLYNIFLSHLKALPTLTPPLVYLLLGALAQGYTQKIGLVLQFKKVLKQDKKLLVTTLENLASEFELEDDLISTVLLAQLR